MAESLTGNCEIISKVLRHEADNLCQVIMETLTFSENDSMASILSARLVDHASFLRNVMNEAGQGKKVASYTECNFGKWYERNRKSYSNVKAFVDIDKPHQKVHIAAEKISKYCTSNNAQELIDASVELLKYFIKLFQEFKNK